MVVHDGAIESEQVEAASAVGVLQIWGEQELEDGVEADLVADILEARGSLGDGEQKDVALLVCGLGIVRAVEGIHNDVFSVDSAQALRILLGLLGILASNERFPPLYGRFKLNVFAVGVLGIFNLVAGVDEQHDNRLGSEHVLENVRVVGSVTVGVEEVKYFFLGQDSLNLVENFEVVFLQVFVEFFHLAKVTASRCLPEYPAARDEA
jgi:hypothetical protein